MPSTGRDEVIRVDAHELRDLVARLKAVEDRKLKASLRKALKASADLAVDGVRKTVQEAPPRMRPGGRARSTGLRADIARSVRASLLAGSERNGATIKVVAADSRLQSRHKGMAKAFNARQFRHPVFGSKRWVDQPGQANYFGRGVYGKREEMLRRLREAMDDVARQITK